MDVISRILALIWRGLECRFAWLLQPFRDALAPPKLKYYYSDWCSLRNDSRQFFMAYTREKSMMVARGLLELEAFDNLEPDFRGLKYVSVSKNYRRQGIASELYRQALAWLAQEGLRLHRSRPGDETPKAFTQAMTQLITNSGISWSQSSFGT